MESSLDLSMELSVDLQNLQWKIHLENGASQQPEAWFRVFNTWIPDSPEVFVDVADYSHVEDGPVILLAGLQVNYSLDGAGRRLGLLYDRRQPASGSNADKLRESLTAALRAALRLEGEASFPTRPVFLGGDLALIVNNRAAAPNHDDTLAAVKPELDRLLSALFGSGEFTLTRDPDPRRRFAVQVKAKNPISVSKALSRLH